MKYFLIPLSFTLFSCASYKVETSSEFDFTKIDGKKEQSITLKKVNDFPQGGQCFEPMLFVLTVGIVPTHCVDDYNVEVEGESLGSTKVTTMSGWIPLFMAMLPKWKYGIEPKITKELISEPKKQ